MKRERYLPLGLLGVIALLAVWLASGDHRDVGLPDRDRSDETPSSEAAGTPRRRGAVVGAEAARESAAADGVAVHVPVHGELVVSGRARAEFTIVDKLLRPLPPSAGLSARLVRVVDGVGIPERVSVDVDKGVIRCAGAGGGGLEAGDYAVKIGAGPYGGLWRDFTLGRDQVLEETISLDTWTRVVKLEFADPAGRAVERIPFAPRYSVEDVVVADRSHLERPSRVLRAPPGHEINDATGFGMGGSTGARRRGPRTWLTRSGAWFETVVAGAPGRLELPLSEGRHGRGPLEVESTFEGPEWEAYRIVLDYSDSTASRLAGWRPGNSLDPGNESALSAIGAPRREPDPTALPADLANWVRVVLRADGPSDLQLDVEDPPGSYSLHHLGFGYRDRQARRSNGVWFVDVSVERAVELAWRWSDRALFESAREVLPRKTLAGGERIVERRESIAHAPVEVEIGSVSPTFDGWARDVALAWAGGRTADRMFSARRTERDEDGLHRITTAVRLDEAAKPVFGEALRVRFRGDAHVSQQDLRTPWTPAMSRAAAGGRVVVKPRAGGIILRAVDATGAALPFVEGSVMEFEGRPRAERLRELLRDAPLALEDDRARSFHAELGPDSDRTEMRELLGDELWDNLGDDASRLHAARNGAWYDPWRRLRGDDRGFLVDLDLELEPGRLHVLWLWSRSRDDDAPDRAVVFRATRGLTDLGAIELPRWTP